MQPDAVLAARGDVPAEPPAPASATPGLTRREREVLGLLAEGLTNAQIADRLVISLATVKTYLSTIYTKIGVPSRTAAMRFLIDHRLS
jgi:DNA-binding NarL/FixJ family response regulator